MSGNIGVGVWDLGAEEAKKKDRWEMGSVDVITSIRLARTGLCGAAVMSVGEAMLHSFGHSNLQV